MSDIAVNAASKMDQSAAKQQIERKKLFYAIEMCICIYIRVGQKIENFSLATLKNRFLD